MHSFRDVVKFINLKYLGANDILNISLTCKDLYNHFYDRFLKFKYVISFDENDTYDDGKGGKLKCVNRTRWRSNPYRVTNTLIDNECFNCDVIEYPYLTKLNRYAYHELPVAHRKIRISSQFIE